MRLTGLVLMASGWIIVLAALALLPAAGVARPAFTLAGIGVEILGLAIVFRSYAGFRGDEK